MLGVLHSDLAGPAAFGCLTCGANLGGLGQTEAEMKQAEATVMRVIDGSAYREIKDLQSKQREQNGRIASAKLAIDQMPESAQKATALGKWQEAKTYNDRMYSNLRQATDKYNELARTIRLVSLNSIEPKMLAGLGFAWALMPAILKAAAWIALALIGLLAVIKTDFNKGDGALAEIRKTVAEVGGVVHEGAKFTYEMTTMVALLIGGFFAFQIWQQMAERRSGGGYSRPAYVPESIKTVEGEVE